MYLTIIKAKLIMARKRFERLSSLRLVFPSVIFEYIRLRRLLFHHQHHEFFHKKYILYVHCSHITNSGREEYQMRWLVEKQKSRKRTILIYQYCKI